MLFGSSAFAMEARFPRHPALSPDASRIAFSWQGDIWLVDAGGGEARRLTAHPASERHPIWSRDGQWLAFASNRHGSYDVFVSPTDGSTPPLRLTHASIDDFPVDFGADGESVLFISERPISVRNGNGLYSVPLIGGTPVLTQTALTSSASVSPEGTAVVFVRGHITWSRHGYRGSANTDLWLHTSDGDYVQLTDFNGADEYPSWIDNHTVVFLSERNGRKNIFRLNIMNEEVEKLTEHEGSDVRFPRTAANGEMIAYEFENSIWTVSATGGEPTRLRIEVPADFGINPTQRRTVTQGADELAISPDGTVAAFILAGDVFVTAVTSKQQQGIAPPPTVQVTSTPEREKNLTWAPDGSSLLMTSAHFGQDDVFQILPVPAGGRWLDSFQFQIKRLTNSPDEEHSARFSPDSQRIAFIRGKGTLIIRPIDKKEEITLLHHWFPPSYDWSPDGRWIAYSVPDANYNNEVFIVSTKGGIPYNVSRHPDDDMAPYWSPDGRRLLWLSKRGSDAFDIWAAWLQRADHERSPTEWMQIETNRQRVLESASRRSRRNAPQNRSQPTVTVAIDFEDLWRRSRRVTRLPGNESTIRMTSDGHEIVFTAEHESGILLYRSRWDGRETKQLTSNGDGPVDVEIGTDNQTVFFLDSSGAIRRVGLNGEPGDTIPYSARFEIDLPARRAATFDEAWRALREWFYDSDFHGVDWPAVKEQYRPWALEASHEADFDDVMNLMVGQLNASHNEYTPPISSYGEKTGWIGVEFQPEAPGPGLLISEVIPDSPAARQDVDLKPGDRILSVNNNPITTNSNIFAFLADMVDDRVPMRIQASNGDQRQVIVYPISTEAMRQLRYRCWVSERRAIVDRLSNGRLGYLHLQGMNAPSFKEFERNLYASGHGKEGLIIDVRSNEGGWTTDYLVAALTVKRHAYAVPRDAAPDTRAYPQSRLPWAAWTRPALALCNEDSASNAEIFAHAFQRLKRGLVVGSPTVGAVISTGRSGLINGGSIRLPMRGWYEAQSGINMENNGLEPDVIVWQPPEEDVGKESDTQLERAVAEFLTRLESDPRYGLW
jgi:tricorn protease